MEFSISPLQSIAVLGTWNLGIALPPEIRDAGPGESAEDGRSVSRGVVQKPRRATVIR
jgi:hypothetical protein